jgi:hypothetical protein
MHHRAAVKSQRGLGAWPADRVESLGMKLPRYSLRTLFVAITLFALWLGWEVHRVQSRKDWVAHIQAAGGNVLWCDVVREKYRIVYEKYHKDLVDVPDISWYRRLLGDRAVYVLNVAVPNDSDPELGAAKSVFPEAHVMALTPGLR